MDNIQKLWVVETPMFLWSTAKPEIADKYRNKEGCFVTEYARKTPSKMPEPDPRDQWKGKT